MHHDDDDDFDVEIEYLSSPDLEGKTVILCDPMLATGSSMVLAYKALLARGNATPSARGDGDRVRAGRRFACEHLPGGTTDLAGAIDEGLTPRSYIVPGLGDAGDLAYGSKK